MGNFASKDGQHLLAFAPDVQRLQIVADQFMIHLGWESIIPFVAGQKRADFSSVYESLHRVQRGVLAVIGGHLGHIDVVQGGQVIKMQDVVRQMSCAQDKIAENSAVFGYFAGDAERVVEGEGGGDGVARRTYSANALSYVLSVSRVSSTEDKFNAPEKSTRTGSLLYHAVIQDDFNLEVAFNTGNRVYQNAAHLVKPPLFAAGGDIWQSDVGGLLIYW